MNSLITFWRVRLSRNLKSCAYLTLAALFVTGVIQPVPARGGATVLGVDCSQVSELGIDMQMNLRASMVMVGCGLAPGGSAGFPETLPPGFVLFPNANLITGADTFPHVTASETMNWGHDNTIVVTYNDSHGRALSPINLSGVSVSTDSGATFTRLLQGVPAQSPFTGHGANFGDPVVVFNEALGLWFAGFLVSGCGSQGIGLWTSPNGLTWSVGACAHVGAADDRESMWVNSNPASPFFGRMYISWNDFSQPGAPIFVTFSDDGTTWSSPVLVGGGPTFADFVRNVQLTGSPDDEDLVFIAGMHEGGGQFNNRTNIMFRSDDAGLSWIQIFMGFPFAPVGDMLCTPTAYFPRINPIWRMTGFGQPAAGPLGVVHYVYAGKGVNFGDTGDIFYTRSDDNALTWSAPIVLNSDQANGGTRSQWMPSITVNDAGRVRAKWYDRRSTVAPSFAYEVWGIESPDNGLTFNPDFRISNQVIPQPAQPDPGIQACYAGDYDNINSLANVSFITWTDGRIVVPGPPPTNRQAPFFGQIR